MSDIVDRVALDGGDATITVTQEWIDVRSEVQPMKIDPDWTWTDPAGHTHDASLSKAVWKVVRVYWCEDCCEEHEESELVCRYCEAEVKPRRVPDYDAPDKIPGLVHGHIEVRRPPLRTDYHLTPDLLNELKTIAVEDREAWIVSIEAREDLIIARDFVFGKSN